MTQNIKKQANPPTVKKYGKRVGWAAPLSVKSAKIGGSKSCETVPLKNKIKPTFHAFYRAQESPTPSFAIPPDCESTAPHKRFLD